MTTKPMVVATALRNLIADIGEERNIEYDEERVDEVVKKLMDIAVSYDNRVEWNVPIREVLVYDLNLPVQYISSNYLGNTVASYIADLYWTPNETIMLGIGQSITQITPIAAGPLRLRHRQRRHCLRRADHRQDHRPGRHRGGR